MSIQRYLQLGRSLIGSDSGELVLHADHLAAIAAKDNRIKELESINKGLDRGIAALDGRITELHCQIEMLEKSDLHGANEVVTLERKVADLERQLAEAQSLKWYSRCRKVAELLGCVPDKVVVAVAAIDAARKGQS